MLLSNSNHRACSLFRDRETEAGRERGGKTETHKEKKKGGGGGRDRDRQTYRWTDRQTETKVERPDRDGLVRGGGGGGGGYTHENTSNTPRNYEIGMEKQKKERMRERKEDRQIYKKKEGRKNSKTDRQTETKKKKGNKNETKQMNKNTKNRNAKQNPKDSPDCPFKCLVNYHSSCSLFAKALSAVVQRLLCSVGISHSTHNENIGLFLHPHRTVGTVGGCHRASVRLKSHPASSYNYQSFQFSLGLISR